MIENPEMNAHVRFSRLVEEKANHYYSGGKHTSREQFGRENGDFPEKNGPHPFTGPRKTEISSKNTGRNNPPIPENRGKTGVFRGCRNRDRDADTA